MLFLLGKTGGAVQGQRASRHGLFSAGAGNDLADFLHIAAEAGNGVAAGQDDGGDGEGEEFFHSVFIFSG